MPQSIYSFMESQAAYIEQEVYRTRYPDIQYHELVPVSTEANPFARTIRHYSQDMRGFMQPLANRATDVPLVDIQREKYDIPVEMSGLGYDWSIDEIEQARMLGINLTAEKALAVRRGSEEYIDKVVNEGDSSAGWDSLMRPANVTRELASGSSDANRLWSAKTAEQILADINNVLQGVHDDSRTVELADTLLLPPRVLSSLVSKVLTGTDRTVYTFIMQSNVYTARTGQPLMIREYRGLESAGRNAATSSGNENADSTGGTAVGRMIAYRRDPQVLKLHMPMPLRFLPPWQVFSTRWVVLAIIRLGGLEIRLPKAMRAMDGISTSS